MFVCLYVCLYVYLFIHLVSYHFYAGSSSRDDPTDFEGFFPMADAFFVEVQQMQAVRAALAPHVKTTIDESMYERDMRGRDVREA